MGFLLKTRVRTGINRLLRIQYRAVSLFFRRDVQVEPNWYRISYLGRRTYQRMNTYERAERKH